MGTSILKTFRLKELDLHKLNVIAKQLGVTRNKAINALIEHYFINLPKSKEK